MIGVYAVSESSSLKAAETEIVAAERAIDLATARFYAAFDNRDGRSPEERALRALFLPEAIIVRLADSGIETMSVERFLEPRIRILSDGTLEAFHEWEVTASTVVSGDMACRQSAYRKAGRLRGQPCDGGGRKLIQLVRAQDEWRIASVTWQDELWPDGG